MSERQATESSGDLEGSGVTLRRLLPIGLLLGGLVAFFAADLDRFVSFQAVSENHEVLQDWVAANPVVSRLGYAAAYALSIAFSLPVGLVLTVTGGLVFGLVEGTVLTVLAATVGALAVFLAARTAIGDSLRAKAGPFVARLEDGFRENALSYLLVLRLVPIFPFWLVNIVPALLGVSTRVFLIATAIGIVPGTFVFVSVGNGLDTVFDRGELPGLGIFLEPTVLVPIAGLTLLALVPVLYKRLRRGAASSA
ncbi:TVP38/TMEM64 family protein [Thalassobaculum sp. OXR-137]|uniref:TVP38/TMEM64 family protein n=1 Tax=Thalassobaculum sp. OXR-137 TaxID=3100173 RepID=UPI002AC8DBAD|nr:TVP38/TMEM64 family protein [Thalassobaculum sp. OXR-137]WPZ34790.1 TVP38/TMEM64 family protein [Thalassobaculum sp. OXR-137]